MAQLNTRDIVSERGRGSNSSCGPLVDKDGRSGSSEGAELTRATGSMGVGRVRRGVAREPLEKGIIEAWASMSIWVCLLVLTVVIPLQELQTCEEQRRNNEHALNDELPIDFPLNGDLYFVPRLHIKLLKRSAFLNGLS